MISDPLEAARSLIFRFGWNVMSYQILNPGIKLWFSSSTQAVAGYTDFAGYRVIAGAPICADGDLDLVSRELESAANKERLNICYFGAQDRLHKLLSARGTVSGMLLGAQPSWAPSAWNDIVESKSSLRAQLSRARHKGVTIELWPATKAHRHPDLESCLAQWLASRGLPPMHFLVEPQTLEHLDDRLVFVATREGKPCGFLIATPIPLRQGWLIEQIVRSHDAPNGTTELLLHNAVLQIASLDSRYVTLGLSPLSKYAGIPSVPTALWVRVMLGWLRAHGRRFYNFDGLDAFKAKFLPQHWEPVYALTTKPRITPNLLYAIAGAFSARSPILFVGQGLLKAVHHETRWAMQHLARVTGTQ